MRSADITMFIVIQMYKKWEVTFYKLCSSFFEILTFSALRVGLHLMKKLQTSHLFYPEYIQMTKCGQIGIKIVYNHTNDDYVVTGVEKM